ncbi:MAG: hypothetical protein A3C85_02545 [Candidatus Doudnabacteria bacterium RIFCSPHIGHO2_02_FULL_48_21]|uniref:Uncharacterized protein n=1 Tax=Candidatus Doudnabacteria bacterium RIFCSPLOWO2_02_FULL_48_13 TaxID=1817845 RepID=A0A1F5QE01_9BACT|nr:MAG: hypothetical protein A3K05_00025 [Candidatus Doudnabacteria bacterium RIFCSPHIGHO2_01_48_18]OGE78783.1 MAG: hypothetical protein A2668_01410 [Candidatus Doudnabacteria bacterium RIFCSPHIGHO2_01_FULL_48_180]OGE91824.1 MAG: hypothetical protein A3F44_00510 [Candidatus Doudnabacteria bacterium RIFCSPHIGHO2_12_FULL_47_25]OGE93704.1 MAG: hypothetical protein A3C85_02545 [Candidatus Doudnabacteria bacterium RIFCSPHIGHO2_02_FULL_48_21]OGE97892.1 MAG: hypothetical protein A3A83_00320 [Candidatu
MDRKRELTLILLGLQAEQSRLTDEIADTREGLSRLAKPTLQPSRPASSPATAKRKTRKWTAAQRKVASERAKAQHLTRQTPGPTKKNGRHLTAAQKKTKSVFMKQYWKNRKASEAEEGKSPKQKN